MNLKPVDHFLTRLPKRRLCEEKGEDARQLEMNIMETRITRNNTDTRDKDDDDEVVRKGEERRETEYEKFL